MLAKEHSRDFLFIFAFGVSSVVELQSLLQRSELGKLKSYDSHGAIVTSNERNARSMVSILGGVNKVARILTDDLNESVGSMFLPDRPKFNWTVSGYGCTEELLLEARQELHLALKKEGLGKSKFLEPKERPGRQGEAVRELDVLDLRKRILPEQDRGVELIVYCARGDTSHHVYAETIDTIDVEGFETRDFGRPFQDPTRTVSPRLGRVLMNMAISRYSRVLDPFCGLGTTLAEALLLGCDVVGTDRSNEIIGKAKENLRWVASKYSVKRRSMNLFAYDARRISRASMPPVGAIATEPILLPIYRQNPSPQEASQDLGRAMETYERCLFEFADVLRNKGFRLAFTSPSVFDSSGAERGFSLDDAARSAGFRPYYGGVELNQSYPLKIELQKKRIVHRNFNVYELA
jgi:SAM-dependent methyltransferase